MQLTRSPDNTWPLPPGAAAEAYGEQDPAFKRLREKSLAKRTAAPTPQLSQPRPAPDADTKGYRLPYKDD